MTTRRKFLTLCGSGTALPAFAQKELAGGVGITCATLAKHVKLHDLPKVARYELGMRVLDLTTANVSSFDPAFLEKARAEAEKTGCVFTNLKMNQRGLDLGSENAAERARALKIYTESAEAAQRLGMRWIRPLPTREAPENRQHFVDSMRRLAEVASERGLTLLVENYGWMQDDPNSVVNLISKIDRDLPASPDTGNWNSDEIRFAGLEKTFLLAATCDFKVKTLGPNGEHAAYDLKKCFQIGWDAGFRGPWCIEHGHNEREILFRELRFIRDWLKAWMRL